MKKVKIKKGHTYKIKIMRDFYGVLTEKDRELPAHVTYIRYNGDALFAVYNKDLSSPVASKKDVYTWIYYQPDVKVLEDITNTITGKYSGYDIKECYESRDEE